MWRDLKYLLAYSIPLAVALSLYFRGIWSYNGIWIAFVAIPLLEVFFTGDTDNLTESEENHQNSKWFFDLLLYLNVPMLVGLIWGYFHVLTHVPLETYEWVGLTLTMGVYLGGVGINVAHELGHRSSLLARSAAGALLLPNLYMHFTIEHNYGHHVNIATPKDPASSRYNESVYGFWVRSVVYSYLSAWQLENRRLRQAQKSPLHWSNTMIHFQLIQLSYLVGIGWFFGWGMVPFGVVIAVLGFLMLETVNYIEHYGLQRKQLASGRYEPVQPWHSWNCNHDIGRIVLYELTRHSDHHYKATRKYQVLRHFHEAPLLPWGYPTSMLIALVPPLWFKWMNPRVDHFNEQLHTQVV